MARAGKAAACGAVDESEGESPGNESACPAEPAGAFGGVTAVLLAAASLLIKPYVFKKLWVREGETPELSQEVGVRLGQISEFSLLIAYVAIGSALISEQASILIQATTIITLLASSYIVVLNYPTPIAISDRLRRD